MNSGIASTWVSGLPRSATTSIHPFVQYAKVTLLEISPCQCSIVKRSGVAYSGSYVLLVDTAEDLHWLKAFFSFTGVSVSNLKTVEVLVQHCVIIVIGPGVKEPVVVSRLELPCFPDLDPEPEQETLPPLEQLTKCSERRTVAIWMFTARLCVSVHDMWNAWCHIPAIAANTVDGKSQLSSARWLVTAWFKSDKISKKDFSGWRPAIAFLYLFLFHSLLRLTSFLSQYKNGKSQVWCSLSGIAWLVMHTAIAWN